MRLQRKVTLWLLPIIGLLIASLTLIVWLVIFQQTKQNLIKENELSLHIAAVELNQYTNALNAALVDAEVFSTIIAGFSDKERRFKDFAIYVNLLGFTRRLGTSIDGFKELILLDQDLNLITLINIEDIVNFRPNQSELTLERTELMRDMHARMQNSSSVPAIKVFSLNEYEGSYELVAAKVFSLHAFNNNSLTWINEHYIMALVTEPGNLVDGVRAGAFEVESTNMATFESLDFNPGILSRATADSAEIVLKDSLVELRNTSEDKDIILQLKNFSIWLIVIAISTLFSLHFIVIKILNRQILLPINNLAKQVEASSETGVIDIKLTKASNEVTTLGKKYSELMNQISILANVDALTGLPNRAQFLATVDEILKAYPRDEFALLYMDLDRFKQINDFYGHAEGDLLLAQVGRELKKTVEEHLGISETNEAVISRLAGDEFAVFVRLSQLSISPDELAEILIDALEKGFDTNQGRLYIGVSIGISRYPEHSDNAEMLVARADEAMFAAKNKGRNRWQAMSAEIIESNNLIRSTQEAIEESLLKDQFYLVFQPVFTMADKQIVSAEVLLRSRNPGLSELGTQAFIEIAENNGAIRRIDKMVFKRAIEKLAIIRKLRPDFRFAINFSAVELISSNFIAHLEEVVADSLVPASSIELEITETVLTEFGKQAMKTLEHLHKAGFTLSLDDFGTGYNSFAQLSSQFIGQLKIDKSFIAGISTESKDSKMVDIVLGTSKLYGLKTIAEGVETEEQLRYLEQQNCDFFQGYLMAKPMEWEEFLVYLEKN